MGDNVPFFGDHVELSDGANDFASTLGVGGVVGTQFVLPSLVTKHGKSDLTPAREKDFEKWLGIYREKMLSKGQYLGQLYDIGFDVPETHVIRKGKHHVLCFLCQALEGPPRTARPGRPKLQRGGLRHREKLGTVAGHNARLPAEFDQYLLIGSTAAMRKTNLI